MSVASKTKPAVSTEHRSEEILDAARIIFSRNGFDAATIDEIAAVAGVAKGTVYLYFPSKQDLYTETLRRDVRGMHQQVAAAMESEVTVEGRIRAFITTRIAFCEANRDFFRIYYSEFSRLLIHPVHVRAEFRDLYDRQARALKDVLDAGVVSGEVRPVDTDALARLIYDTTRGVMAQRMLSGSDLRAEDSAAFVFDVIWKGVGCQAG